MELSLSGWVTLACAVLIVAVLGHAFWLRWRTQRNRLRIQIDPAAIPTSGADDLDLLRGELPNGGARVKTAGEVEAAAKRAHTPPVLLDTVPQAQDMPADDGEVRAGPRAGHDDAPAADRHEPPLSAQRPSARRSPAPEPLNAPAPAVVSATERPSTGRGNAGKNGFERPASEIAGADKASAERGASDGEEAESQLPEHEELFVMQVLCRKSEGFELAALMAKATQAGLKFGDFNIFHRYKDGRAGRNRIEYSMANAVEPGAFDLSDGEARTRGVAFFMRLPLTTGSEPIQVFEDMLKVVQSIAQQFDGEVLDERQGVMSMQTIEHCRERIHEFTRRQQVRG